MWHLLAANFFFLDLEDFACLLLMSVVANIDNVWPLGPLYLVSHVNLKNLRQFLMGALSVWKGYLGMGAADGRRGGGQSS